MNLFENQIKNIIAKHKDLSYLEAIDVNDGSLFVINVDCVNTLAFNECVYSQWEKILDYVDVIKNTFQVYCSWDRSGFKFWDSRNESNYTHLNIWVSDDFSDNDIESLCEIIDTFVDMVNEFVKHHKIISTKYTKIFGN